MIWTLRNTLNSAFNYNTQAIALFAALVLLISCTSNSGSKNQDVKSDSSRDTSAQFAQSAAESPFPPNIAFYNELMRDSKCDDEATGADSLTAASFPPVTGPITFTQFAKAVIAFAESHTTNEGLDYYPTKLAMDTTLINFFSRYSLQEEFGLVFHYGYDLQSRNIIYILSKGRLVPDTSDTLGAVEYCPFEAGENYQPSAHYIALEPFNGRPFRIVGNSRFSSLTLAYRDSIRYRTDPIDSSHPLMVYHDPKRLVQFYQEYARTSELYLYIGHGAVKSAGTNKLLHTPCYAFGDNTAFFALNDVDEGSLFGKKALDIGRLCPPNCKSGVSPGTCTTQ